jgi:hypothetical protein
MAKSRKPKADVPGAALLTAASLDTAEQPSPLSVLRQRLAEYTALAATAKAAQDMAEYRIWSERSAQAARDLLPYEPPDQGNRVTKFPLLIFDSQRRPVNLELTASTTPAPAADEAKPADGEVIAHDAVKLAEAPATPPPEAPKQDDDPPADNPEAFAWRRGHYFAQFAQPEPHWIWTRGRR